METYLDKFCYRFYNDNTVDVSKLNYLDDYAQLFKKRYPRFDEITYKIIQMYECGLCDKEIKQKIKKIKKKQKTSNVVFTNTY